MLQITPIDSRSLLVTIAILSGMAGCGADPADSSSQSSANEQGAPVSGSQDTSASSEDNASPEASASSNSECTTNEFWTRGDAESSLMHPGLECVSCHKSRGEGPRFTVAGTLYPSLHEVDDCFGVDSSYSAQVVITDADGQDHTLKVNSAGNFMLRGSELATPYTAKVIYNGQEFAMVTPQSVGDCNSCHTHKGSSGAPGRINIGL